MKSWLYLYPFQPLTEAGAERLLAAIQEQPVKTKRICRRCTLQLGELCFTPTQCWHQEGATS